MFLHRLVVKNFRALADIEAEFDKPINVIVGPNASGKTTVLEAIRLAKALLAPRTQNESNQALMAIGAMSPHLPGRLLGEAIARDQNFPTEIRTQYNFSDGEVDQIEKSVPQIATNIVGAQVGQQFATPASLISFLSSPVGAQQLQQAESQIKKRLHTLRETRECNLDLMIDFRSGRLSGQDAVSQSFFSFIEQRNPPSVASFSYFPADRALPPGEPPVQLGGADINNQLESHNSQPQLKFSRLKNTIFNAVISSDRRSLDEEFEKIFKYVLKGRSLADVGVNPIGLLSIKIKDTETNRIFDLDGMSSGEKGLILTSLMTTRTVANSGVVLLDEPELHLNPAICRDVLSFLSECHVLPRDIQMFLCSHSVEMLNAIFDRDECALYHLASESSLSRVRKQDRGEIGEALRRLGSSEAEGLLYKGTIFVEGEHDVDLLETGYADQLRRYKLRELGGRGEIERQIRRLQEAEGRNVAVPLSFFIFDSDRRPANLQSSQKIRVLQWPRYCLENFLLDVEIIADLLMDEGIAKIPLPRRDEAVRLIKRLWESQLNDMAIREAYLSYGFESLSLRSNEINGRNFEETGATIFGRIEAIQAQVGMLQRANWLEDFVSRCDLKRRELEPHWQRDWPELCDGKRLLSNLHREIPMRLGILNFKKRIMMKMSADRTDSWKKLDKMLGVFLE